MRVKVGESGKIFLFSEIQTGDHPGQSAQVQEYLDPESEDDDAQIENPGIAESNRKTLIKDVMGKTGGNEKGH
jgi:hypothetical protein